MMEATCPVHELPRTAPAGAIPRVFVVEDDVSVRESLELLVRSAGWDALPFASATAFLAHPKEAAPSCVVLDVGLPDGNGLDVLKRLAPGLGTTPLVFISGDADIPTTVRAIKAGAVDFLTKPVRGDALITAIESALEASSAELRREGEIAALRARHGTLTPREREVMALVVAGRLNKLVAADLGISEITVKAHRGSMMRKMMAKSLAELVKMAGKLGIGA